MEKDLKIGCGKKPEVEEKVATVEVVEAPVSNKEERMLIGKPAPDFKVNAYHNGEFVERKLSDYQGKWLLLCFYPGDFTFV